MVLANIVVRRCELKQRLPVEKNPLLMNLRWHGIYQGDYSHYIAVKCWSLELWIWRQDGRVIILRLDIPV
ncbi:uncharacterized protein VTP21DRAFT_8127 [Calcarisporiella thermophila]|uniref:uncharacterized protein n=1 Tax=Calcarisporiella thermophila TaxID=911321 RepID=UPI00374395E0